MNTVMICKHSRQLSQKENSKRSNMYSERIPVVFGDNTSNDCLNIDISVCRSNCKMRCVNARKTDDDQTRINKLEVGSILYTFIDHIPEGCVRWELPEDTPKEEPKEESKDTSTRKPKGKPKENNDVLNDIKRTALKMKSFDSCNE